MIKDKGMFFAMIMIIIMLNIAFISPLIDNFSMIVFSFIIMFCAVVTITFGGCLFMVYKLANEKE